jgi:uncharacterized repeat protein (TIGR04138 family)
MPLPPHEPQPSAPQQQQSSPLATSDRKPIDQVIAEQGLYPREAFDFVRRGLSFTVERVHAAQTNPGASRHVSGQQLCHGLRDFALARWGLMARTVLRHWNLTSTEDFGKIVFTLIESAEMSKTDADTIADFKHVYDFATAFGPAAYRMELEPRRRRCTETRP